MAIQPFSIASEVIDRINRLKSVKREDIPEFELHRIRRDAESVKKINIYDYHMLMGMYFSLKRDVPNAIRHHENSLHGGMTYHFTNYAFMLRNVDLFEKGLEVIIKAFNLELSAELAEEVFAGMIHAADTTSLEEIAEKFERANPGKRASDLPSFRRVILMQNCLAEAGLSEEDYRAAKSLVDRVLREHGLTYQVFQQGVNRYGRENYFSTMLFSDYPADKMTEANMAIADAIVDSELRGWDRMIFTLISQPSAVDAAHH